MTESNIVTEKLRHQNRMKELEYIRATEEHIYLWRLKLIVEKGKAIRAADTIKRSNEMQSKTG